MRADRQTDSRTNKQTYSSQYFARPSRGSKGRIPLTEHIVLESWPLCFKHKLHVVRRAPLLNIKATSSVATSLSLSLSLSTVRDLAGKTESITYEASRNETICRGVPPTIAARAPCAAT